MPELAVLSVMAHGKTERGAEIVRALVPVAQGLDANRATLYLDLTYLSVGEAASRALEALMRNGGYQYQSEFARKYYGEGEREGERKGRREERATSVLTFLEARGLAIPPAARERILGCQDLDELARWVRRAATVSDVNELFDEIAPAQPREPQPRR